VAGRDRLPVASRGDRPARAHRTAAGGKPHASLGRSTARRRRACARRAPRVHRSDDPLRRIAADGASPSARSEFAPSSQTTSSSPCRSSIATRAKGCSPMATSI
jgi:hypothetical protein